MKASERDIQAAGSAGVASRQGGRRLGDEMSGPRFLLADYV